MKTQIFFLEAANAFTEKEKQTIQKIVSEVSGDISEILDLRSSVILTFYRFGERNSGFTQAKDWISVSLSMKEIDFEDLRAMLYHELHHIKRGYTGYLEAGHHFLLNSLFSEGLATALEIEKQSPTRKTTHNKYTLALVKEWLPKMRKELYRKGYDYEAWFQGKGKPRQLGYRIGTYLVDQIRKRHPELTHKDLATKDARSLLKLSGITI